MDDRRVGLAVRALRRRKGWRHEDLAAASGVPQSTISEIERGHLDGVPLRTLRAVFAALDAGGDIDLRWRGGAVDRLMDERHAGLVERIVRALVAAGWQAVPEVTYSQYGERGSIDVVGVRLDVRAALIVEAKWEITAIEETNRRFDPKIRLAPTIVREQFGFTPAVVGAALVLPESTTARRHVAGHAATFASRYPGRTIELRRWLLHPVGPLRAIWFLPDIDPSDPRRRSATPARVMRPRASVALTEAAKRVAGDRP